MQKECYRPNFRPWKQSSFKGDLVNMKFDTHTSSREP